MAREYADITQAAAAKDLGLSAKSKSTLSAWEQGRYEPKASIVEKMARLYGVPLDVLMRPPVSAYEVLDRRLSLDVRDAEALERGDWARGVAATQAGVNGRGGAPRTRSA